MQFSYIRYEIAKVGSFTVFEPVDANFLKQYGTEEHPRMGKGERREYQLMIGYETEKVTGYATVNGFRHDGAPYPKPEEPGRPNQPDQPNQPDRHDRNDPETPVDPPETEIVVPDEELPAGPAALPKTGGLSEFCLFYLFNQKKRPAQSSLRGAPLPFLS